MSDNTTPFDDFWEASSLSRFNVQEFASLLGSYDSDAKTLQLDYSDNPLELPLPRTTANKLAEKRQSQRNFSDHELSLKDIGTLLSSFYAWNGLEHRSYPSAGASYVTEVFCVGFNVEEFTGKVLYYDAEKHGIHVLPGEALNWEDARKSLNIAVEGVPGTLLIFVIFPERATEKYGDRGGRFALIEAGAALQQLALQIGDMRGMKGVAVGGMLDEYWKRHLNLSRTDARIAAGYLVGK